jgi:hypothetical protein
MFSGVAESHMTKKTVHPLSYSAEPEPLGRWLVKRAIVFFVSLFFILNAPLLPNIYRSVDGYLSVSRVQAQCAKFDFPDPTIAFDLDAVGAAAMLRDDPLAISIPVTADPAHPAAGRTAPCWGALVKAIGRGPINPPSPTVFCHGLRGKGNRTYVIHIEVQVVGQGNHASLVFEPACRSVVKVFDGPLWFDGSYSISSPELSTAIRGRNLRIYAGHVDPNNPSHVVIPLSVNGIDHHLDGYMRQESFEMKPGDMDVTESQTSSGGQSPW